jgi:hypothetical protein
MTIVLTEVNTSPSNIVSIPRQADSDQQLVELWLHGRSVHTQRAYRADVERFLEFASMSLAQVTQ